MNRTEILRSIRTMLERNITEITQTLDTYRSSSDIDETDTHDPEDFSQQTESRDMVRLVQQQLDNAQAHLSRLENLADKNAETVEPGAIVKTDKNVFFIGVSFPSITEGEHEILGISPESPAYNTMRGKTKGDSFKLGNHEYTITGIL